MDGGLFIDAEHSGVFGWIGDRFATLEREELLQNLKQVS